MPTPFDLKLLRRVAGEGQGTDVVPVSRNWLRAALKEIEAHQFPVLDAATPPQGAA